MKFGKVEDASAVDFTLPPTRPETLALLKNYPKKKNFEVYVGCAKWNKTDLKGFYPPKTKDELAYYATQFNSIELNATYYNTPSKEQVRIWKDKTPADFRFFPKITQSISHYSRLLNTEEKVKDYTDSIAFFEEKLGCVFLQLHENFKPKDLDRLSYFIETFPKAFPLAVEVRNEEWFADQQIFEDYCEMLMKNNAANIIVDTAGRRDMLHMRLTNDAAFIRYVGANHASDYERLDEWIDRLKEWRSAGLRKLYFFIHQNVELESPLLATYFIKKLNEVFGMDLRYPNKDIQTLF